MKFKLFNTSLALLLFTGCVFAQKYDKKHTEKFYANKDVEVEINASNAEIEVTSWNRDEVWVQATITVEGLPKKEAEAYLESWGFEAVGNKSQVSINANSNRFPSLGKKGNVIYFNAPHKGYATPFYHSFPQKVVPGRVYVSPEVNVETWVAPELELQQFYHGLDNLEFDFDRYSKDGENYFFQFKDDARNITIKSKREWEKFKKSKEFKKLKKQIEKTRKKIQEQYQKALKRNEKMRAKEIKELKAAREKREKEFRKNLKNSKYSYFFSNDKDKFIVNGKEVKITKTIIIKVPKKATFDLNTRHCKIRLPKGKASGKVSYGTFKARAINGGELNVYYSPVDVNTLNACTLFLNNVTDANFASVANTELHSNSSGVKIKNVNQNVILTNTFGNVEIVNVSPNYNNFKLMLNYSDAVINLSNVKEKLIYTIGSGRPMYPRNSSMKFDLQKKTGKNINGNFTLISNNKKVAIKGKYSQLSIKE